MFAIYSRAIEYLRCYSLVMRGQLEHFFSLFIVSGNVGRRV